MSAPNLSLEEAARLAQALDPSAAARFEARAMAGDFAKTADTTKATQRRRTRTEAA